MGLITSRRSHIESELTVHMSKLESEGIRCYLRNEFTTRIINYMPSFEVELQVSSFEADRTLEIIDTIETVSRKRHKVSFCSNNLYLFKNFVKNIVYVYR